MPKRGRYGSSFTRNGADSGRGRSNNGRLSFEVQPLGVGTSRLAYGCRVCNGCYRGYTEGSYCIFKVFKPEARYQDISGPGDDDVDMQKEARRLAQLFNDECSPTKYDEPCDVHVRDAELGCFDNDMKLYDQCGRRFYADEGTTFLLERKIRGSFEKFNSNSGWTSGRDPILDAFSHWTWVETRGEQLVCDLQGHRGELGDGLPHLDQDYYYLLTDPAVCSRDRMYGESDLGPAGIDAFFRHHVCNEWCRALDIDYEKPTYSSGVGHVPRTQSTSYHSLSVRYCSSTSSSS